MLQVHLPYGKEKLSCALPDSARILTSRLGSYVPEASQEQLIEKAMAAPMGSAPLEELARGKEKVVIICSDHTRPVPSKLILPPMLSAIRRGNPQAEINLLIATGCHRGTTKEELLDKFGPEICQKEHIVIHDCGQQDMLTEVGTLPSGSKLELNKLAVEADLLLAEGFIEPHFFAGFSGGRKSVLPGIASRTSVLGNHCSEFIAHPRARTGLLEGNPIHEDMLWAAKRAKLRYIVNVVLNEEKQVIHAVAGDPEQAHAAGCAFLLSLCQAKPKMADIVITTNGGYPLDQNIYQAVKGMTAAEATVNPGGVIIMLAKSNDGHGGEAFYRQLSQEPDMEKTMGIFMARGRDETEPDQWQSQILLRILGRAKVFYLSEQPDALIRQLHMTPVHSVEEALEQAKAFLGKTDPTITVIPDGIGVMVTE